MAHLSLRVVRASQRSGRNGWPRLPATGQAVRAGRYARALRGALCLSRIEKSQFLTDRNVTESVAGGRAGRQQFIDLMVERAVAGEAPSSPQPPEAGARRARLYGASPATDNRNRQTMPSSRCGVGWPMWRADPAQPTLNIWLTCPWRRGADWLRASARSSCRSRICERTAPRCLFSTMVACETCRNLSKVV